ncbi:TRAP transporter permease [Chloroflexota bacterium]
MERSIEFEIAQDTATTTNRYEYIPGALKAIFIIFTSLGIGLSVFFLFGFSIAGQVMVDVGYHYLLIGVFLSSAFLILPARKKDEKRLPFYDLLAAAAVFGITFYYFLNAWRIGWVGWIPADTPQLILGIIMCVLVLEGGRRISGLPFTIIALAIATYPLFASSLPGLLYGMSYSFNHMIAAYAYGTEGLVGLPAKVMGNILMGFLLFAGILIATGAGDFFLKLAYGLLGKYRGGPAKVAVIASGFFGSMSGSALSNVVATGSITIPAMKRIGYPPHYAGAIEACASTGGIIMPPIMGAVAFVAAMILNMSYATIMIAAIIPAILYYFGLLMQTDCFAAKTGLQGMPEEEIPSLKKTLLEGWPFITVLLFLIWGLVYMRWEALTPFYASGLLVLLSFASQKTRLTPKRFINTLVITGKIITQTMAVLLPMGLIIGALIFTGMSLAFTAGLVHVGGGNLFIVLLLGIVACYIMGMAGIIIPAYIFLALTLAPALIELGGLNLLATHLLIIYYSILALITPPVALAAFIGANIAGASPMKTGFTSMRLGVVIYFIPLFFLFSPALVLQGPSLIESLYLFVLCLLGIAFIAAGMEGYFWKIGTLAFWSRSLLAIAGFLIAFPRWDTTIIGTALALFTIVILVSRNKVAREKSTHY